MEVFTVENLTFTYPKGKEQALKEVSFSVKKGELICLCGKSGCGKSTLLRNFKTVLTPHGEREGRIRFFHRELEKVEKAEQSQRIGYVLQNPDNQLVTDKVWHELAFGLENLGYDQKTIRLRVSEMASYFGIQNWFEQEINTLSGGQKQLLNLAAVMVMQPDILVLDEPTAQLDPIAAGEFLDTVRKINRDIGTTVIIAEHRLEEIFACSDKVMVLDEGKILIYQSPEKVSHYIREVNHDLFVALPTPAQVYFTLTRGEGRCPLTVREGRMWLEEKRRGKPVIEIEEEEEGGKKEPEIVLKNVWFRYEKHGRDVVKDLSFTIERGEMFSILGGNGTGKTTTIKLISGMKRAYRGKIYIQGKSIEKYRDVQLFSGLLGVVPQNPQSLFVEESVEKDLLEMVKDKGGSIEEVVKLVEIENLLDRHPYDISGGEQQRVALAKVLLLQPEILLLDEPTKGLDNFFKIKLGEILNRLKTMGTTIVMVSHDVEFCAKYANRCGMFFDGSLTTINNPRPFFSGNSFYTTGANRMSKGMYKNAIIVEDFSVGTKKKEIKIFPRGEEKRARGREKKKITKPMQFSLILGLMIFTLIGSLKFASDKGFYVVSVLLIIYMMIPFFLGFERKKPKAREVVVIAVLIGIGVAGRLAFFMIPQVKPVLAIAIIAGTKLGPNRGFVVGSMIAFVSNFMFGQGPWTPWQMFALGLIGFLAGMLFYEKEVKKTPLLFFGGLSAFLYGLIVDLWSIFIITPKPTLDLALVVYGTSLPFNLILGTSTIVFLFLLYQPLVGKIGRIQKKYGVL